MNAEDAPGAFAWGAKAVALADGLDDEELRIVALNDPSGRWSSSPG
jgi:hypothetical protein